MEDFAGRSEKGTLWIMLWTWASGHLVSHLCHRVPTCPWASHPVVSSLFPSEEWGIAFLQHAAVRLCGVGSYHRDEGPK